MANLHDQTPTSEQQKSSSSSSDKISDLPDEIIHHILSLVPTKQAVATSILSKRWLPLWTLVPILDLEDSSDCSNNIKVQQKFIQFVSNVLQLNKSVSLEKFRLKCYPSYTNLSSINKWIFSATERGLQELDISFSTINSNYSNFNYRWRLPSNFFNVIRMLKVLKLSDGILVDVPGTVSFPNLRILHLVLVKYWDDRSVCNIFSGCLVLQELLIKTIPNDNAMNFNISIPTLKSLSIELSGGLIRNVQINAPALEYLNLKDDMLSQDLLETILYSIVYIISLSCERTTQILKEICSVKSLSLSGNIWCYVLKHDNNPMFVNLVRLELNVGLYGWNLIPLFLQNSHILQVLVLSFSEASQVRNKLLMGLPKHVPKCFLSHLETVCFRNFAGLENELQLIEYILTNARVLKTMTICSYGSFSDSDFLVHKKLSMIPRCSEICQLELKYQESEAGLFQSSPAACLLTL